MPPNNWPAAGARTAGPGTGLGPSGARGAGQTGCGGARLVPCNDHFELVFDRAHHLIGAWNDSRIYEAPQFGPHGEIFTLASDSSILELKVALPGA